MARVATDPYGDCLLTRTAEVRRPSENLLAEVGICGSKLGRDIDKGSRFDTFYCELKTAPTIGQCPITIECGVTEILDYDPNEGIIGKVVKPYVDPRCLTKGNLDMRKVHPIIRATGGDFNYYRLGGRISKKAADFFLRISLGVLRWGGRNTKYSLRGR